jgi:hypothetical protein
MGRAFYCNLQISNGLVRNGVSPGKVNAKAPFSTEFSCRLVAN